MGLTSEELVAVGDDVVSDIEGAKGAGSAAVFVRTGKHGEADLARAERQPDAVVDSVVGLPELLRGG
jgi:ribonucleotide monophosphatase NagD (HAD superfamily)